VGFEENLNPLRTDSPEVLEKKLAKANGQLQNLPEGDKRTKKEATIEFLKQAIADRQKAAAEQAAFEKKFPGVTNRYIQSELKTWTEGKANWKKIEGNGDPEDPFGNGVFRLDGTGKDMDGDYHDRFVLYKPQLENEVATRYERVARIETSPYNDEEFYPLTITKDNLYILNEDGMRGVAGTKIGIGEVPGLPNGPSPPGVPRRPPGPNPRRPLPAPAPTAAGRRRKTRGRRHPRRKTSRRKQ
jgi:hypothetical protein